MSATVSPTASISASSSSGGGHGLDIGDKTNTTFKIVGICLAIGSGVFIGTSFVVKKKGLLSATRKYGNKTGEGHAYLKNWIWWTGMIMMVIGEILNFVAYAFTEAILVTPMGALSVVISAILSHFFLSESLTFFGWIGCILCILGATILALNAPEQQSVTTIEGFKRLFIAPGFLVWMSLCIVVSLGIKFFVVPKWGRTSMLPFVGICSLIGGISVSCTQGVGASIVTSIGGDNQVKNWFFWFVLIFVVITLLVEINYLNKALEIFNTALVVPVYFVMFTTCVLVTSFILYQGLKASAVTLITMVLGFLVICLGITLLQMSKVDPSNFKLDRRTTILLQTSRDHPKEQGAGEGSEKEEVTQFEDPGMDALRGGFGAVGSIIRARSVSRRMSRSASMGGRWYDEAYDPKGMQRVGSGSSGKGGLNTMGMENLRRYQLTDQPMPEDASARIAYHRSPTASSIHSFPTGDSKARSHLKFEEQDVVHQYDPQSARHFSSSLPHDQLHINTANLHAIPPHLAAHRQNSYGPSSPGIMRSPSVFTVPESPDEYNFTVGTAQRVQTGQSDASSVRGYEQGSTRYSVAPDQQYSDPYINLRPLDSHPRSNSASGRSRRGSGGGNMFAEGGFVRSLGSIFNFHPNPDLSLRPPPSPRSASPSQRHNASFVEDGAPGVKTGSGSEPRRTSDTKDRPSKSAAKGVRGSEEEERRGLVEAGRMSEEMADIGYGRRGTPERVMGPRDLPRMGANRDLAHVARLEANDKGEKGGLERIETVLDGDRAQDPHGVYRGGQGEGEEELSSPEASPVRPAQSGF